MAFQLVDSALVRSFLEPLGDAQPPEGDYMNFVLICLNRFEISNENSYVSPCCIKNTGLKIIHIFFDIRKILENCFQSLFCLQVIFLRQYLSFVVLSVCRFKSLSYLSPSSGISIVWRADSWRRRLLNLQTLVVLSLNMSVSSMT